MNIHSNWIKQIKVKNFKLKKLKNSKVKTRNYLSIARKCIVLFCSCSHKLPPLLQDITWSGLPWWPVPVYLLIVCIWDSSFCQRNEAGLMEGHLLRTVRVSQHGGVGCPPDNPRTIKDLCPSHHLHCQHSVCSRQEGHGCSQCDTEILR